MTIKLSVFIILFISLTLCQEIKVVPTKLDSPIDQVLWCGSDRILIDQEETIILDNVESKLTNILFLLSDDGQVYITNSHGAKWSNFTLHIQNQFQNQTLQFRITQMMGSAANTKTIFLFGDNGTSFVVTNCGKQVTKFTHDPNLSNIQINRMNDSYILGTISKKCSAQDEECDPDELSLVVTEDQGQSWRKVLDNVCEANWDKLIHYEIVPDYRILVTHRIFQKGPNNDLRYLSLSDDFFKTKQTIVTNPIQYYQSTYYLFVLTPNVDGGEGYTLKISPSFSENYTPQEIDLPIKRIKDHSFTVLDTYGSEIYLAINHENELSKMTNIYSSDIRGQQFQLTLMNSVRNLEGNVDFERILGTQGTFISNVYDNHEIQRMKERGKQQKEQKVLNSIEQYKKTKISFNNGGLWHSIKAPQLNYKGEEINCQGECSLNLKGRTEKNGNPIYSTENSPGIIVATGNTGIYLEQKENAINTYLSRDGGHNWFEIKKNSHMYEIGDHGGIIVIGRDDSLTSLIEYSWDQGQTWTQLQISQKPIEIENIVTEPSNMKQKFLVYAKRKSDTSNKMIGVVISLDFTKLHTRVCEGHIEPETEDSDYEYWSPTNYDGQKCVFGVKITYVRRKRSSQCFNPEEYDSVADVNSCECSREDWECEFGYILDEETNDCKPMSERFQKQKESKAIPPANCKGHYLVPTGYKKVPGSYCEGGIDLGPKRIECPIVPEVQVAKEAEYIPFDQDQPIDLDLLTSNIKNKNQKSNSNFFNFSNLVKILAACVVLYLLYAFKDQIVKLFSKTKSNKAGQFQYKRDFNENQSLFNQQEDDEETI